jgi:hypothetical protein
MGLRAEACLQEISDWQRSKSKEEIKGVRVV